MKVLGLCSYPKESAATRFRLEQYIEPLGERGIELTVSPFLDNYQFRKHYQGGGVAGKVLGLMDPVLKRVGELFEIGNYDLLFIQREAMFFGPAIFERLFKIVGQIPVVLDLDDATYVPYVSPSYGQLGSFFKFFGKTDNLIRRSELVICGNRFIAEYVEAQGKRALVVPTVVDTDIFRPADRIESPKLTVGWIGTHSTFPLLEAFFPVLERTAKTHAFRMKIVGSGREEINLSGVEVENLEWKLDREVADFQSLDIGLYPITVSESADQRWLLGKSGFKAIQYMAVGVPFVMSPVGVCAEIGEPGKTHFNAETDDDWYNCLVRLLQDEGLRARMGREARVFATENYGLSAQADKLARAFYDVCG